MFSDGRLMNSDGWLDVADNTVLVKRATLLERKLCLKLLH
ncbi:unnamed protein product [Lathyrus sativus]|nr:unnamed protein product [Lathyrus sativus]